VASPATLLWLHHPLIAPSEPPCISCASFISHSSPQKEPPPFEGQASHGPACQLWAPDVLAESRHPHKCLPSPHLLPVMKTEGTACSDWLPLCQIWAKRCLGHPEGWELVERGNGRWHVVGVSPGPSTACGQRKKAEHPKREAGVQGEG